MIYILFAVLLLLIFVIFWQLSLLFSSIVGAPTVYANSKAIIDSYKLAGLKKGETVLDLGCGNAKSLIIAAKEFGAKGLGVEISPYCYLKSKLNVLLARESGNIKIYLRDIKKSVDLISKADLIYLYLLNSVLEKIEREIFDNIDKNARVVTLAFKFKKEQAQKTVSTSNLGRKTKVYLYQKGSV